MKGKSPWLRKSSALPTRSALLIAMNVTPYLSSSVATSVTNLWEQARLLRHHPSHPLSLVANVRPLNNKAVVSQGLVCPLLPLADRIEPVSQIAGDFTIRSNVFEDGRCTRITVLLQCPNQPLGDLPDRESLRHGWIPVAGEFIPTQQPHLSALGPQDAILDEGTHCTVLSFRERLSDAIGPLLHTVLFEPRDGPACIGVVLALLLG